MPRAPDDDADPDAIQGRGTSLSFSNARPVPMLASEFILGIRNVEAFDDECQPLDLTRAIRAARSLAMEEERLIYYGDPDHGLAGLLTHPDVPPPVPYRHALVRGSLNTEIVIPNVALQQLFLDIVSEAVPQLADRGFPGHYALAVTPQFYTLLFHLMPGTDVQLATLLRELFYVGYHMVPVIQPFDPDGSLPSREPVGVIVTAARPYLRLVLGQDWTTAYRGTTGAYHRFLILCSLRLEIWEPRAIQVLRAPFV